VVSSLSPYREGQINELERVQKKAAKFARGHNHKNGSDWESLAQRRKIARICALFNAYTGERAWKAIGERLQGPCYFEQGYHDRKIRSRKQKTDTGKYFFVNRTIKLWNNLPAEALATFHCKPHIFRKRVRKLNISEAKCSCRCGVKCREVKLYFIV
jgi:hypothetical protein